MFFQDHPITVQHDYDSLLGLAPSITIDAPLSVYPIGLSHEALSTSVHQIRIVQFLFTTLPFLDSGAPEIRFISFFQIYTCSPALSAKEQASFYEHCLCPTIVDIMLTAASDWPL